MTSRLYPAALFLLTSLPAAAGALYKCSDGGATTYTNNRDGYRNCLVVSRDGPAATTSSGSTSSPRPKAASNPTPADFPRVSSDTQKARDTDRQHILEQEVATEQKGLDEARKTLAEQEAARAPADRLQPYRDRIALHSRNLDALRRELGKVK